MSGKSIAAVPLPLRRERVSDAKAVALPARAEWRRLADLGPLAEEWRDLAGRALEPNVFYDPAFALAAAPVFGAQAGAVLVRSKARLIGLFPARIARRYGVPLPVLVGWTHPYAPLGVPLVDRNEAELAIGAFLAHVAGDRALPKILLLPHVPEAGPLATAFQRVLAQRGGRVAAFGRHQRALLAPGDDRASYLDRAVGARRRKDLARQRRRLDKSGSVTTDIACDPVAVAAALTDFLRLEASGWKGHAQTAAAQHIPVRAFMEEAVSGLAADGHAEVHRFMAGDRAIAAAITLRACDTTWFWKIAYDETYARFSPGVQLALAVTESILSDPSIVRADSCAPAGHPMIDHLWRERLALSDLLVAPGPEARGLFHAGGMLESCRRGAIAAAKGLRGALRKR